VTLELGGKSPNVFFEDVMAKNDDFFDKSLEGFTMFALNQGQNRMRVFQEEIFGPVVAVTTFKDEAEALAIANDTLYGLGAGAWSRDGNTAYRMGRGIQAGRVWTNCYHLYPAHAAFGGQPFYIGLAQFGYWRHTQLVIDVVAGRGGMFSLEGVEGVRFLPRSRIFTDEEHASLVAAEGSEQLLRP
jgi:acyl-CoA reductase-like NAD-dependent aldehyde dehydrogenase